MTHSAQIAAVQDLLTQLLLVPFGPAAIAQAAALRPYRLRVVPRGGASAAAFAARMPYPDLKLERLLTLNGVDDAAGFAQREQVKIIEP